VAVLPLPAGEERWWAGLLDGAAGDLRVVARLPFAPLPGYPEGAGGLVLAPLEPEPSGDDLTLLAIETDGTLGGADLCELLTLLSPRRLAGYRKPEGTVRHLLEVAGFLPPGDQRLAGLLAPAGGSLLRVAVVGCYARPLAAAALE
jgi:hypothetical protein